MAYQFSPIKCMSWKHVLACVIVAAITFAIGWWLGSFATLTIHTTYGGGKVVGEGVTVTVGEQSGPSPFTYRGRRRDKIEAAAEYQGQRGVATFTLKLRKGEETLPIPEAVAKTVRLDFKPYDTMGNRVPDVVLRRKDSAGPWQEVPTQLEGEIGSSSPIVYKSTAKGYKEQGETEIQVEWQDRATHEKWIDDGLREQVQALGTKYDAAEWDRLAEKRFRADLADPGHSFLLLFRVPGDSKPRPPTPTPTPTPTPGPDTPISWKEITSQRKLRPTDLQGKSPLALWLTKNELYARKGEKFRDLYLQWYFGKQSWYTPQRDNVGLSGVEEENSDFLTGRNKPPGLKVPAN